MKSQIENMHGHPLFSILIPTYNSNIDLLKQVIDSVRAQIYPYCVQFIIFKLLIVYLFLLKIKYIENIIFIMQ